MKLITKCLLHTFVVWGFMLSSAMASPVKQAVIIMYHHISSSTPPSTSISPEKFAEHMAYIKEHFTVIDLATALNAVQQKQSLPANAVVITFDDGFKNILENGHELMRAYEFPYTVFINPSRIGSEKGQLTWDDIKTMQTQGVTFANHTNDHLHLLNRLNDENEANWLARVWRNIEAAQSILVEKLGSSPKWLAYPFGEYNKTLADKLLSEGYVGFGQHSGALSISSDFAAIPRFPAAGIYANLNTLKVKLRSLAMPIVSRLPASPERPRGDNLSMTFTVKPDDISLSQMQCYYQGENIAYTRKDNTFSVDTDMTLPTGRSRVNCTAPSLTLSGRYYWYSQPFFVANEQGEYPN